MRQDHLPGLIDPRIEGRPTLAVRRKIIGRKGIERTEIGLRPTTQITEIAFAQTRIFDQRYVGLSDDSIGGHARSPIVATEDQADIAARQMAAETLGLGNTVLAQRRIGKLDDATRIEFGFAVADKQQGHGLWEFGLRMRAV